MTITMSDVLTLATVLTPVALAVMAYLTAKANGRVVRATNTASDNAEKAALAAEMATNQTTDKLDVIHTLVNSRLSEALAKIERLEARIKELTGEPPTGEPPPTPA